MREPITKLAMVPLDNIDPTIQNIMATPLRHFRTLGSGNETPVIFYISRVAKKTKHGGVEQRILLVTLKYLLWYDDNGNQNRAVHIRDVDRVVLCADGFMVLKIPSEHDVVLKLEHASHTDYLVNIFKVLKAHLGAPIRGAPLRAPNASAAEFPKLDVQASSVSCDQLVGGLKINLIRHPTVKYAEGVPIPVILNVDASRVDIIAGLLRVAPIPTPQPQGDSARRDVVGLTEEDQALAEVVLRHPLFHPPGAAATSPIRTAPNQPALVHSPSPTRPQTDAATPNVSLTAPVQSLRQMYQRQAQEAKRAGGTSEEADQAPPSSTIIGAVSENPQVPQKEGKVVIRSIVPIRGHDGQAQVTTTSTASEVNSIPLAPPSPPPSFPPPSASSSPSHLVGQRHASGTGATLVTAASSRVSNSQSAPDGGSAAHFASSFRDRLESFFKLYDPNRLPQVGRLILEFMDRENECIALLHEQYGITLQRESAVPVSSRGPTGAAAARITSSTSRKGESAAVFGDSTRHRIAYPSPTETQNPTQSSREDLVRTPTLSSRESVVVHHDPQRSFSSTAQRLHIGDVKDDFEGSIAAYEVEKRIVLRQHRLDQLRQSVHQLMHSQASGSASSGSADVLKVGLLQDEILSLLARQQLDAEEERQEKERARSSRAPTVESAAAPSTSRMHQGAAVLSAQLPTDAAAAYSQWYYTQYLPAAWSTAAHQRGTPDASRISGNSAPASVQGGGSRRTFGV